MKTLNKIIALILILVFLNTINASALSNFTPIPSKQSSDKYTENTFKKIDSKTIKNNIQIIPITSPLGTTKSKLTSNGPLQITSKTIIGNAYTNEQFTIKATANDPDDKVTGISLGKTPYGRGNWQPQSCSDFTCIISWNLT